MKEFLHTCLVSSFMLLGLWSKAQTAGSMTFNFTQQVTGQTKNVLAVWIEDASGNFVKTKMRFWGNGTDDHLPTWVSKSAQNVTDATTGATRTSSTNPSAFGSKTVTWNGTNASGVLAPDGTYTIFVESAWQGNLAANQHNTIVSYTFTKSATSTIETPASSTYFSSLSIQWTPEGTGIDPLETFDNMNLYPNPAQDFFTVSVPENKKFEYVIYNQLGQEVTVGLVKSGQQTIDIKNLEYGVYFVILKQDYQTVFKHKLLKQ